VVIAATVLEMRRGHEGRAGVIFALCSIKFHLLLLLPVLILTQRRWTFLRGLLMGGTVLFALSFVPAGGAWPMRWLSLLSNPIGNPWPEAMPNLYGLTYGMPGSMVWQAVGSVAVAVVVWMACRRRSFEVGLAAVLIGGILVTPHAYLSDCALAVPALLILLPMVRMGWERKYVLYAMSPVCSIWAMLHPTWITTVSLMGVPGLSIWGIPGGTGRPIESRVSLNLCKRFPAQLGERNDEAEAGEADQ